MVSGSSAPLSRGVTASGSSGSYFQIWQWLLLAGLVFCCLCTLAMCIPKKSKKGRTTRGWKPPTPAPSGAVAPASDVSLATDDSVPLLPSTQPIPEPVVESLLPSPDQWQSVPLVSPPFITTTVVAAVTPAPCYEIYPGPMTISFP